MTAPTGRGSAIVLPARAADMAPNSRTRLPELLQAQRRVAIIVAWNRRVWPAWRPRD